MEQFTNIDSPDTTIQMFPDGVFFIKDKETKKTLLFFLEVDMGTETLQSTKGNPNTIEQKVLNYQTMFQKKVYKRYEEIFNANFNGFRLLFLTNTLQRKKSLCELVRMMTPTDFVWVTDQEQMSAHGVSADIWSRGGHENKQSESILGEKLRFEFSVTLQ